MTETADCLTHAPESLKGEVERLLAISPLFVTLMRTADGETCRNLFQDVDHALLPDAGERWLPPMESDDLVECMAHLRRCKRRALRHFLWWELGVRGDIEASYRAISTFAAGALQLALTMAERLIEPRYGRVTDGRFTVIGLGKLGGEELNLGSDVDLLFIWQGDGLSEGGRKSLPAYEYFGHLARMLIRLISEHTNDGVVWPVDMRLRPGGKNAAISLSLEATLTHYLEYAQTWERAMLIKAKPVAGDLELGGQFLAEVTPFIYRRYLDYTTVSALADMKRRINQQAGSAGIAAGFDVKRGRGGIREIEFIIQSLQLLHGGRSSGLKMQSSLAALVKLAELGLIDAAAAGRLADAYRFWRRVEHAVQARNGEQTHRLPEGFADYLATALGLPEIRERMIEHARFVEQAFDRHVMPVGGAAASRSWLRGERGELDVLDEADRGRMRQALNRIDTYLARGLLPERSREQVERILEQAMPRWLDDANGVTALEAFAELIHAIAGRATWIDLLATHQGALSWLIGALSASRYLADHIVRDPSWLEWPLAAEQGHDDVRHVCEQLDALAEFDDVEQVLAEIGRWVDRCRLLSALAIDAHKADPVTVGGWMADVADAATSAALRLCHSQMDLPENFPFVALAMGKHGSREMGLVSDLDMVFVLVHDRPEEIVGRRSFWEHAQRTGRRMIQYLTGAPPFGAGYELDARLRPSGSSGILVTNLSGFRDYQLHQAQTWEHQALCRARAVAGPAAARQAVDAVVREVLDQRRDPEILAADVVAMRRKMLDHLSSKSEEIIDLKHDAGGLVDIEFLAQYARLAFGGEARSTVDILRQLPADAPEQWRQEAEALAATYIDFRQMENALRVELWRSIGKLPSDATATEWETMRRHAAIHSPEALQQAMWRVHGIFNRLLGGVP